MTDCINESEDDNGLVASKVLIRDNCTENWSDVTPELEEVAEARSSLLTETEITLRVIVRAILNVILEWRRQSVECESFAQLHNDDKPV